MDNISRFACSLLITIFVVKWNKPHWSYASSHSFYLRMFNEPLRIISVLFLILLSSCRSITTESHTQSSPTPAPLSTQPSFSRISEDNTVNLSLIQEWQLKYVNAIAWAMDGVAFTVAGANSDEDNNPDVYAYKIGNSEIMWSTEALGGASLTYHPDNHIVAVPYFEGISLFDATTGQKVKQIDHNFMEEKQPCIGRNAIKFTPDGARIITIDTNAEHGNTIIYIWDAITDQCLGILAEEEGYTFDFELSGEGQFLVLGLRDIKIAGHREQQVHVWDVETRQLTCSFEGARPVTLTLDGRIIAAGRIDKPGDVDIWDSKTCQLLDTLRRQEQNGPFSMDFSPDGQLLSIGNNNTFQIWQVATRKLLFESDKLPNRVKILAFSPDGQFLLSVVDRASVEDKATITLWGVKQ